VSKPDPSQPEQAQPEQTQPAESDAADAAEELAPLNRAERRAKEKKGAPTHVGPRGDLSRQVRGARPHSKRPS
jgi:hypothetical protein